MIHKCFLIIFLIITYSYTNAQTWSTYYGGTGSDTVKQMVESNDYIYIVGTTSSPEAISTYGAYQQNLSGGTDCFISKFDKSGKQIWGTYFGGPDNDYGTSICYNSYKKFIIITGFTTSKTGIASAFADQYDFAGGNYDSFIAVFDLNGALIWSTYFGGAGDDISNSISAGDEDTFVIGGQTNSTNLKVDHDAYQQSLYSGYDGFIAVFNIDTGKKDWVTYFGGNGNDKIKSVLMDSDEIYFAGSTDSDIGISKGSVHNSTYSGNTDGFFGKFKSKSVLEWASYYGGNEFDELAGISKNYNDIYVVGTTKSKNLASLDAYYNQLSGGSDVIFSIFRNEKLEFSSYFGGNNDEIAKSIFLHDNNFYIIGKTNSPNKIALKDSYKDIIKGNSDAFFCVYDKNYNMVYSSYFGGENDESGNSIIGNDGDILISGSTNSSNGIANLFSHQKDIGGLTDGFISKYYDVNFKIKAINKTEFCTGDSIFVDFKVVGVINKSNSFYLEISDKNGSFNSPEVLSIIESKVSGSFKAIIPPNFSSGMNYKIRVKSLYKGIISEEYFDEIKINSAPHPNIIGTNQVCNNSESYYTVTENYSESYEWSVTGGIITEGSNQNSIKVHWYQDGIQTIYINVSNGNCTQIDSLKVAVNKLPDVTLNNIPNVCINDGTFELSGGLPVGGKYYIDDIEKSKFEPNKIGIGKHKIEYKITDYFSCKNSVQQIIEVFNIPPKPLITKQDNNLISSADTGNQWYLNGNKIDGAVQNVFKVVESGDYNLKVSNSNNCSSEFSDTIHVEINPGKPILTITSEPKFKTLICNNSEKSILEISNSGNADLIIDSLKITGLDYLNFSIDNNSNIIIPPNQSFSINVIFNPSNIGIKIAILELYANAKPEISKIINLNGEKQITSFKFNIDTLDFGDLNLDEILERELFIINDGSIELNLTLPDISGNFKVTEISPSKIKSGDTAKIKVEFESNNSGKYFGNFNFKDSCGIIKSVYLKANVKPIIIKPIVNIEVGNVDARSGDELNIPIYVKDRKLIIDSGYTEINLNLEFNSTLLHPINDTPLGEVINNTRIIHIKLNITNDSVFVFPFKATLGNDSVSVLTLKNISISGSDFDIKERNGLFRLLDLCNAGGTRLINFEGEISITMLPNPALDYIDFSVNLIENGFTKIFIANYNGEIVKSIIDNYIKKGRYDSRVDISDLASGNYFVKIATQTYKKTYKFNIVK